MIGSVDRSKFDGEDDDGDECAESGSWVEKDKVVWSYE